MDMDAKQVLKGIGLSAVEAETNPGLVIKAFRERMIYEDQLTGKLKHWTQQDLGNLLGLTKVQICNMENHNEGLDSIERRKALATILKIPPVLLGLASLDAIVDLAVGHDTVIAQKENIEQTNLGTDTIEQYQTMLKAYEVVYAKGLTYDKVYDIEKTAKLIVKNAKNAKTDIKGRVLRILWDYELLCASVYGSDLRNWHKAFEHLDNALEVATHLEDSELLYIDQ